MKKFKKLISVLMAALMVLALSSCDLIQDAEITPAIPDGTEAGNIRIGILYSEDYEKEDTAAFVQQSAINKMNETYGIAGTIPKNKLPLDNPQKIEDAIISCVKESGCNVVLSTDPAFTDIVYKFANNKDYQNIVFVCLDPSKKLEATANFHCFYPNYEEAYCLAGIAAATNGDATVKFTADDDAYLDAFKLGVKAVNPKAKVINGSKIDTYGEVVTNWHIYYITLVENITLGKFSEMGNYYAGIATGFCDFVPAEEFATADVDAKLTDAKANLCEGKWDIAKADSIAF
ncbi:MAG: BMP family ABC transporter substrate-binding protein [Clostridia bacterium]|nr:BMP family ABC transporter substrate-binding protein [Clostridia bacterium]